MLLLWILLGIYLVCVVTMVVSIIIKRNYMYDIGQEIRESKWVYIIGTLVALLISPYFIAVNILTVIKNRRNRIRGVKAND